jgi:hypothetical protein
MSSSRGRDAATVGPSAFTAPAARHAHEAGATADDIVQRALTILEEEGREWVEGQRRANSTPEWADTRPDSLR